MGKLKTIEEMQEAAKSRGGYCLSSIYVNTNTKLQWECALGHTWEAVPKNVLFGNWCPFCSGNRKTIEDMQELAEHNGGECLSEEYFGSHIVLDWKCYHSHKFTTKPRNIIDGTWCPICSNEKKGYWNRRKKLAIEMRDKAVEAKDYISVMIIINDYLEKLFTLDNQTYQ